MPASLITDAQVAHQIQQWAVLISEMKLGVFFYVFGAKAISMHEKKWIGRMCLHEEEIYLLGCDHV